MAADFKNGAQEVSLPPVFRPHALASDIDPFGWACAHTDVPEATFAWSQRSDRVVCAITLAPDRPFSEAVQIVYVAMLAAGDALGALIPPIVAVMYSWPDRFDLNGAFFGGVRLYRSDDETDGMPNRMVLGLELQVANEPSSDTDSIDVARTSLQDEGCVDITVPEILEAFARQFQLWINRWDEDGFEPVKTNWIGRDSGLGAFCLRQIGEEQVSGQIKDIADNGDLILDSEDGERRFDIARLLSAPIWLS